MARHAIAVPAEAAPPLPTCPKGFSAGCVHALLALLATNEGRFVRPRMPAAMHPTMTDALNRSLIRTRWGPLWPGLPGQRTCRSAPRIRVERAPTRK